MGKVIAFSLGMLLMWMLVNGIYLIDSAIEKCGILGG